MAEPPDSPAPEPDAPEPVQPLPSSPLPSTSSNGGESSNGGGRRRQTGGDRAARDPVADPAPGPSGDVPRSPDPAVAATVGDRGRRIVRASWAGTVVFAATAGVAVAVRGAAEVPALVFALGMFVGGTVAFLWAYGVAVRRSRHDEIAVSSLYLLAGSAPKALRLHLLGSLAAQVVIAIVTASVRPFTSLAFGALAPMWGLGLAGLWSAHHGTFPARRLEPSRRSGRSAPRSVPPAGSNRRGRADYAPPAAGGEEVER